MRKFYDKLVRDRIPEVIDKAGKTSRVYQLDGDTLRTYAFEKLREEVEEFVADPCAEEAADILEILDFICNREGIKPRTITAEKVAKHVSRGGFEKGLLLEWVEDK